MFWGLLSNGQHWSHHTGKILVYLLYSWNINFSKNLQANLESKPTHQESHIFNVCGILACKY